jgi:hypothetical protein
MVCRSGVTHTNGPPTNPGHFIDAVSYKSVTVDSTDNDPDFTDTDHIADADNYWRRDLGVVQKDAIRGC